MRVKARAIVCTGCGLCEIACGYHRDEAFSLLSSSVMIYRAEEKKNYFAVIVKTDEDLFVGRPEGEQVMKLGELQKAGGGASAKPILIRESCDMCEGREEGPLCVKACPRNVLFVE